MFFFSPFNLLRTYSIASNMFLFVVSTLTNVKRCTKKLMRHILVVMNVLCPFNFLLKVVSCYNLDEEPVY